MEILPELFVFALEKFQEYGEYCCGWHVVFAPHDL